MTQVLYKKSLSVDKYHLAALFTFLSDSRCGKTNGVILINDCDVYKMTFNKSFKVSYSRYVANHSACDIFQSLDEINIDGTEYSNQSKLEQYTFNHYTIF